MHLKMTRTATAILAALIAGGTVAALAIADPAPATFSGTASAVDGDTLRIGAARVRLAGIDSPESAQLCTRQNGLSWPCGQAATRVMQHMLARDPHVTCRAQATDRYGRTIATCWNSEGDLGGRLVAQGLAIAYRRYSTAYLDQEAAAKAEKLGIWSGSFEEPEAYRRRILADDDEAGGAWQQGSGR